MWDRTSLLLSSHHHPTWVEPDSKLLEQKLWGWALDWLCSFQVCASSSSSTETLAPEQESAEVRDASACPWFVSAADRGPSSLQCTVCTGTYNCFPCSVQMQTQVQVSFVPHSQSLPLASTALPPLAMEPHYNVGEPTWTLGIYQGVSCSSVAIVRVLGCFWGTFE